MVTDAAVSGLWHARFGQPSSYSLTHAELAAHVRTLRQSGWQSWEIRQRFDFGMTRHAA